MAGFLIPFGRGVYDSTQVINQGREQQQGLTLGQQQIDSNALQNQINKIKIQQALIELGQYQAEQKALQDPNFLKENNIPAAARFMDPQKVIEDVYNRQKSTMDLDRLIAAFPNDPQVQKIGKLIQSGVPKEIINNMLRSGQIKLPEAFNAFLIGQGIDPNVAASGGLPQPVANSVYNQYKAGETKYGEDFNQFLQGHGYTPDSYRAADFPTQSALWQQWQTQKNQPKAFGNDIDFFLAQNGLTPQTFAQQPADKRAALYNQFQQNKLKPKFSEDQNFWLAGHGYTPESFMRLPNDQKQALLDQFQKEKNQPKFSADENFFLQSEGVDPRYYNQLPQSKKDELYKKYQSTHGKPRMFMATEGTSRFLVGVDSEGNTLFKKPMGTTPMPQEMQKLQLHIRAAIDLLPGLEQAAKALTPQDLARIGRDYAFYQDMAQKGFSATVIRTLLPRYNVTRNNAIFFSRAGQVMGNMQGAYGGAARSVKLYEKLLEHIPQPLDPPDLALEKIDTIRSGILTSEQKALKEVYNNPVEVPKAGEMIPLDDDSKGLLNDHGLGGP